MINGSRFKNALISGANNIIKNKEEINALNIFPVPDGDTGTNMAMTIESAANALAELDSPTVAQTASTAASAMLKGARGNSGVILSLLFRGISNGLKEKIVMDDNVVSSTLIRRLIDTGEVTTAARYLGEPYMVRGKIVHGRALGRRIGIPTLNQVPPEDKLLPPFGVYYSDVLIGERKFYGMTNIGVKPTVSDEKRVTVETYLYDFKGDIYGETATVQLLTHRRPEMKFSSVEELKATMEHDIQAGREYHRI